MVWWQYLIYGLAVAFFGAMVGYCFTMRGASQERKTRERDQLRSATRSILVEVEADLKLARQPWQGRLVPFAMGMWDAHKGYILALPEDLQNDIHRVYIEVQRANALFQQNLNLPHGSGYYDKDYREQCTKIANEAEKASKLLRDWLKQEGVEI